MQTNYLLNHQEMSNYVTGKMYCLSAAIFSITKQAKVAIVIDLFFCATRILNDDYPRDGLKIYMVEKIAIKTINIFFYFKHSLRNFI